MPKDGFEFMTPMLELPKTVHDLDGATAVIAPTTSTLLSQYSAITFDKPHLKLEQTQVTNKRIRQLKHAI
jgi:hypothetical protein